MGTEQVAIELARDKAWEDTARLQRVFVAWWCGLGAEGYDEHA